MTVPEAVLSLPAAPAWRDEIACVGVTGTNGKTTTTTWLARALAAHAAMLATPARPVGLVTTLGFFVGDEPQTVTPDWNGFVDGFARLRARGGNTAAVEYTSHALGRGIGALWPSKVAVFTNFTRDHLDHHGSPEHYLACKAQLFAHLPAGGVAVLNAADPVGDLLAEVVPAHAAILRYAVPSRGEPTSLCDAMALRVDVSWEGTTIVVRHGDGSPDVTLSVAAIGEIFAENALAAYLGARAAGVPTDLVLAALARSPAPRGRFEVLARSPGVVVDYAHTPDALARTLTTARALARSHASCAGRVVVLFGAGGERDREKRPLMGEAAQLADRVVLTADNPRSEDPAAIAAAIREGLIAHADVRLIDDRADAIRQCVFDLAAGDVLVIAGKGHEGVQELASGSRPFSDVQEARAALDARRSRGDIVT